MTQNGASASGPARPDSIVQWSFLATSGVSWGGWLVADADLHAPGDEIPTQHGRYVILAEQDWGMDLSGSGLEDGNVFVEWYRDGASGQFLATRAGPAVPVGLSGLGSEEDAAWIAGSWSGFGRGGAVQATAVPHARFSWTFQASSGDILQGTVIARVLDHAPGDSIATAFGAYRITGMEVLAAGDTSAGAPGEVRTTRYWDAGLGRDLRLESAGAMATGSAGLGSEADRVWTGAAWATVGLGGSRQADGTLSSYRWRFEADTGDRMEGWLYHASDAFAPGDTIAGAAGTYTIVTETITGTARLFDLDTVWIESYFDALSGMTLSTYWWGVARMPVPERGLGNETDWAWDTAVWHQIGRGGLLQADVESYSSFRWRFTAASGDRMEGWLYDRSDALAPGDTVAGAAGTYTIVTETVGGLAPLFDPGSVWIETYLDARSGMTLSTFWWGVARMAVPERGLGNETDWAWDTQVWHQIGRGGLFQADVETFSAYRWRFAATSGDRMEGWLYDRSDAFAPGDTIAGAAGTYTIVTESVSGQAALFDPGSVWIESYFDALSGMTLSTFWWGVARMAVPERGLGNETDWAWDTQVWHQIGRGGLFQADVL
jgi:hypothetical protein